MKENNKLFYQNEKTIEENKEEYKVAKYCLTTVKCPECQIEGKNILVWEDGKIKNATKGINLFVNSGDKGIRTSKYIGILGYSYEGEKKTIIISSRFDEENNKNFGNYSLYLIEKAFDFKEPLLKKPYDFETGSGKILDFLLALVFLNQIERACKIGIYRKYRTYEKNDMKVKGSIDFARHIRENLYPNGNGKIAYSYREFSVDNDVNQIILTAYEILWKKYSGMIRNLEKNHRNVKRFICQIRNEIRPAERNKIVSLLNKNRNRITQPFYQEWNKVKITAEIIIRHSGVMGDGLDETYGVLINEHSLFEKYIDMILRKFNNWDSFKYIYPGKNKNNKLWKILYYKEKLDDGEEKCVFRSLPDFMWKGDDNRYEFILDAKNKPDWEEIYKNPKEDTVEDDNNRKKGVIRDDFYQITSYMFSYGAQNGGVVFPLRLSSEKPISRQQHKTKTIETEDLKNTETLYKYYELKTMAWERNFPKFYLLPMVLPSSNIKDWRMSCKEMSVQEDAFCQKIKKILKQIK